jgi:hypothetical protein
MVSVATNEVSHAVVRIGVILKHLFIGWPAQGQRSSNLRRSSRYH